MTYTRWLMSMLLGLTIIGSSAAQDASQPLVLLKANDTVEMGVGDLWEWTGGASLRQKTQWGYNEDLRISPDNSEIAYESWAQLWVEYIETNGMTNGGRFPSNIWVIANDSSDEGTRVGSQLAEATIAPEGYAMNTLVRGVPIWSPDGAKIAWTERRENPIEGSDPDRLVVYDKATQTTTTLVEALPMENGIDTGIEGHWINDSIVILNRPIDGGPNVRFDMAFLIYDAATGEQRHRILASDFIEGEETSPSLTMPVEFQGKSWLGVLNTFDDKFGEWHLIDVETGEVIVPPSEAPFAVASGLSDTSIRVGVHFASQPYNTLYFATQTDGRPLSLGLTEDQFLRSFALSPDGEAIAYQIYDRATNDYPSTVYVWRDGVVTEVPQTSETLITELVWGYTTWIVEFSALGQ